MVLVVKTWRSANFGKSLVLKKKKETIIIVDKKKRKEKQYFGHLNPENENDFDRYT